MNFKNIERSIANVCRYNIKMIIINSSNKMARNTYLHLKV